MKKIYLLLLGFLFAFAVFGQKNYRSFVESNRFSSGRLNLEKHKAFGRDYNRFESGMFLLKNAIQEFQRLDSLLEYEWNGSDWVLDFKAEYDFNAAGLITEYRDYQYDATSGQWILSVMEEYEYDENKNLMRFTDFELVEATMQWYGNWKTEYSYNESNRLEQTIEYQKDSPDEEWHPIWRSDYQYDAGSRLDSTLEYIFLNDWSLDWKTQYTYDENGNIIKFEEFNENDNGGWENAWQEVYIYDSNNRIIEFFEYEWDDTAGEWDNSDRETYSYKENNDVDVLYDYDWPELGGDWELALREEYSYNENYPYEQLLIPWFYHDDQPNFMNHQLTEYQNFIMTNSEWVPYYKGNYFFSPAAVTSAGDVKNATVSFYPNPVNDQITFRFAGQDILDLRIYDATGTLVRANQVMNNKPVNVGQLAQGIYLIRLLSGRNELIFSEKILVK